MKTPSVDRILERQGLLILMLVAVALLAAPALAQAPAAKQKQGATKPVAATAKAEPAGKASGGPQEGIKVHGHWVIEVRNPDGTLADRREFENSLLDQGKTIFVSLLSRNRSAGRWVVLFDGGGFFDANGGCGTNQACLISEGTPPSNFGGVVSIGTDLSKTPLPQGALFPTMLQLKGSGTVMNDGIIRRVDTRFSLCTDTTAPVSPCALDGSNLFGFSESSGAFQAANVVAGQIVQVTVTFSFS